MTLYENYLMLYHDDIDKKVYFLPLHIWEVICVLKNAVPLEFEQFFINFCDCFEN